MSKQPNCRFAVAAFEAWPDVRTTIEALRSGAHAFPDISYLALAGVLAHETTVKFRVLPFPRDAEPIACSVGPVAERLHAQVGAGVPSLQVALGTWLIPRHAMQLQDCIEQGEIVLWVGLPDNGAERQAYRILLASGCKWVGVHDLVGD